MRTFLRWCFRLSQPLMPFLLTFLAPHPLPAQHDRGATIKMLPDLHLLDPVWNSAVLHRESVLPLQWKDTGPITGRLAFPAQEILQVKSADGSRILQVGTDFTLSSDGLTLTFQPHPALQFVTESQLYPRPGGERAYRHRVGHPDQYLLYSEGHWFHDRQIEVTYRRRDSAWSGAVPQFDERQLPKTIARLRAHQPLTLGLSGDSISAGANASASGQAPPFQPAYGELIAAQLQAHYGSEVTFRNRAVGGWSIANGLQDLPKMLAEKPNLLIVAYGMNDVGRRNPQWFYERNQELLTRVRQADPDLEIIFVAGMVGNKEWIHTPREMFAKYRDELKKLTGPGVALADVGSIWESLLVRKHDLDLIGNGLNHPNDFGHRLYAQTILSLLIPPAKR